MLGGLVTILILLVIVFLSEIYYYKRKIRNIIKDRKLKRGDRACISKDLLKSMNLITKTLMWIVGATIILIIIEFDYLINY